MTDPALRRPVVLGRIHGLFGVQGWVKVYSDTRPLETIFDYTHWWLGRDNEYRCHQVLAARHQGKTLIARLADENGQPLPDRDAAAALLDLDIAVDRSALPEPEPGSYYWVDLVGLQVITVTGVELGVVTSLLETGANDVLVINGDRERLVPMIEDEFVKSIDFDAGLMTVDWDPEF